ncbi:MAG TPA: HD domain-containing phosphohydrolase [Dehalococcoidia bacterium]|nr:HD domain-containing phosphohydrolase [Dehalococcoidia bacterium]
MAVARAQPGMVLGRTVYDTTGRVVLESGTKLNQDALRTLAVYRVGEVVVNDRRVVDVAVQPLVPPEMESAAAQVLRQLMTEGSGSRETDQELIREVENVVYTMARECFPEVVGEANVNGFLSSEDYLYAQPARVAGLCMLIAKRAGLDTQAMTQVGMAALLMNVGYVRVSARNLEAPGSMDERVLKELPQHAQHGAQLLGQYPQFGPEVIQAVEQHHERWNGTGYPNSVRGPQISPGARIIAVADTYYELVSRRPDQPPSMPHEAVEFILAYSGELFDPAMVQIFARLVPLYPSGITVRLNTGDVGIVVDSNLGHVGRPVVRVCQAPGGPLRRPYDVNLADAEHQKLLVVEVDPFLPVPED